MKSARFVAGEKNDRGTGAAVADFGSHYAGGALMT
jgi:hypothetical protein